MFGTQHFVLHTQHLIPSARVIRRTEDTSSKHFFDKSMDESQLLIGIGALVLTGLGTYSARQHLRGMHCVDNLPSSGLIGLVQRALHSLAPQQILEAMSMAGSNERDVLIVDGSDWKA